MPSSGIQAVLLDMGGVVLRLDGSHGFPQSRLDFRGRQALLRTLTRAGGRASLDDLESLLFGPWQAQYSRREQTGREADWSPHLERLRSVCGGRVGDLELLRAWFEPYAERLIPTKDARLALQELQDMGLKLALVSNVPLPGELYSAVLEGHDMKSAFGALCFSYDRGTRKPSPALLRMAMAEIGAEAVSTLMVGDRRERDVAAGRAAGTGTVWIRSPDGGGPEPDEILDSLVELPELLRRWQR